MVSPSVARVAELDDVHSGESRWQVLGYANSSQARYRASRLTSQLVDVAPGLVGVAGLPRPEGPHGVCSNPLLVWDGQARAAVLWACKSHRSKTCVACAATYRSRVRRVATIGCLDRARAGGHLGMVTITPPGDPGHRRFIPGRPGRHPVCGCEHVLAEGHGVWNSRAGRRWNALRTAFAREFPGMQYFRCVEPQVRGLLHLHVILWSPDAPVDPLVLHRLAMAAGFGCNVRWDPAGDDPTRFAGYASKYVTKTVDDRGDVPWTVLDELTGELVDCAPTFKTWSQSQRFGCRMRDHLDAVKAARQRRALAPISVAGMALLSMVLGAVVIEAADVDGEGGCLTAPPDWSQDRLLEAVTAS